MKKLKPIDYDISYKYICPNIKCGASHWLFLREVKTKGFRVVCDCGTTFGVKQISRVKTLYKKNKKSTSNNSTSNKTDKKQDVEEPSIDLIESCVKILIGYGFTKNESVELINKAYHNLEDKSTINIIKFALKSLEIQNV